MPTQTGFAPARPCGRSSVDECVYEVSACSLPPKLILGETQAKFPGALPAFRLRGQPALVFAAMVCRPGTGFDLERSIFTFTAQKNKFGRNSDEDFCRASATRLTHALDDPVPWSPSSPMLAHRGGARFRIPSLPGGTGWYGGGEVTSSSLPEKEVQEKTEQSVLTCSTIELLPHKWRGRSDSNR